MAKQPDRISTHINDLLLRNKQAFSDLGKKVDTMLHDQREKHGDTSTLQTLEEFGNVAVDLVEQLETIAGVPQHVHGPTYRTDSSDHSRNPTYTQNEHFNQHITHGDEVNVIHERIYRLSKDLIISTSGQFAFQHESCILLMAVGQINLSKIESQALYDRLKFDYGL